MKILMVGPLPPPYTGQSVSLKRLKESLLAESSDLPTFIFHVNTANSNVSHVTGHVSVGRVWQTFLVLIRAAGLILIHRPDVVYLTKGSTKAGFLRDFLILICIKLFSRRARLVVHLKGGNYDDFYHASSCVFQYLIKCFLKRTNAIIVLGKSLVKMYDFFPEVEKKIVVVENALATSEESYLDNAAHEFFREKSKTKILFLSNLIYSKGYGHLLEACEILLKRGIDNFEVVFAGQFMMSPDDPVGVDIKSYQNLFLERIGSPRLKNYLRYVGILAGSCKVRCLEEADIFILPTQYYVEGQPVSIIEAMAYGCAVISTKYRSIPDLLEERGNALYVDYSDPESIANGLQNLICNPEGLMDFKVRSTQIYEEKFRWEIHFSKMKNVFGIN